MKIQNLVFLFLGVIAFSCQNGKKSNKEMISEKDLASFSNLEIKSQNKVFNDFIYDVGPRFGTIKKTEIAKATSLETFLSPESLEKMKTITSVSIIPFLNEEWSTNFATGTTKEFNEAQLKLLQNFNYSSSFVLKVDFKEISEITGELQNQYTSPHLTIVPEKQAAFVDGKEALMSYLKLATEEVRKDVDPKKFKPAKLFFTVSTTGAIESIHLDRTSGYPEVDKEMIKLIKEAPGTWLPAENEKGEKVAQELVVSFGLMGC